MTWPLNRPYIRPAVPPTSRPPDWPVDERRIAELDERTFIAYRRGDMSMADILIDRRNRIRSARVPSVPVIPGRTTC